MGTTAEKLAYLSGTKTAIKDAIVAKGVEVPEATTFREYADKISQIKGSDTDIDIPNPPQDGKTRLYITIPPSVLNEELPSVDSIPLYLIQSVSNGIEIDWGDESAPETIEGTGEVNTAHAYSAPGDFVITLTPAPSCDMGFADSGGDNAIFGDAYRTPCSFLQHVFIGDGVSAISYDAFFGCFKLKSISLSSSITSIEDYAFYDCSSLASINIPNSVTSIGDYAFEYCYFLENINIPDNITYIGIESFYYCIKLSGHLSIPNGLSLIDNRAFYSCYFLQSVSIPQSVIEIGDYAFSYNRSLSAVYVEATTPPTLGTDVFDTHGEPFVIYVPPESVDAYKQEAGWSDYADYIFAAPEEKSQS